MSKEGFTVMAQYNHEILVNYLRDVYSLELLCHKLQSEIDSLASAIFDRKSFIDLTSFHTAPQIDHVKHWKKEVNWLGYLCVLGFGLSIGYLCLGIPFEFFQIVGLLIIGLTVYYVYHDITKHINHYNSYIQYAQADYNRRMSSYNFDLKTASQYEADLPSLTRNRNDAIDHLKRARSELYAAYGVNIIPNKYRSIYAAYYLYDYFSSSHETDLDKVLQTMLLDQIVNKLDRIIDQQEKIILNQRMAIAMQEKLAKQIQQNHRTQMESIARMEKNQQLQNDYLAMIDINTCITSFFVTADYINKYL